MTPRRCPICTRPLRLGVRTGRVECPDGCGEMQEPVYMQCGQPWMPPRWVSTAEMLDWQDGLSRFLMRLPPDPGG